MNQFQEKKVVNFLNVNHFFDVHKDELFKNSKVVEDVNVFKVRLDSIQQELINAAKNSNEITTEGLLIRSLVIKLCGKISTALQQYAKSNNYSLLSKELYIECSSLGDYELLEHALELQNEAMPIAEAISGSELKDSELNSFKNLIDNLKQIVKVPGMMFNFRANTGKSFDENIEENEKLLNELEELIQSLNQPGIYSEYVSLRELVTDLDRIIFL